MVVILGNVVAFFASLFMVYSGIVKSRTKIIIIQTLQFGLFILSNLILGGITGAIINFISCIRNILCYKNKLTIPVQAILIFISIVLSFKFNNLGIIGLLPLATTISYTLFMNIKNVTLFKIFTIMTLIMWLIYDLYIKSYSSSIFDVLSIITNIIAIIGLNTTKLSKKA